jgi:predicted nucleotidyltransferase
LRFAGETIKEPLSSLRKKVAREAASLLYSGTEKEYKQAKLKAAATFGSNCLPTNLEVAMELDKMADENEGPARHERLTKMRREALKVMQVLRSYDPILVGSVWRGTIHRGSDIDIIVYNDEPKAVSKTLEQAGLRIQRSEFVKVAKKGKRRAFFHIYLDLSTSEKVEIVIHDLEEARLRETCEIYGDNVTGLRLNDLERILKENPTRRFVP